MSVDDALTRIEALADPSKEGPWLKVMVDGKNTIDHHRVAREVVPLLVAVARAASEPHRHRRANQLAVALAAVERYANEHLPAPSDT